MSAGFDHAAASFDRHRALPDGAPAAIRAVILAAVAPHPRLLDLGAGTGRIGHVFVGAKDDYVGVDLSVGMLCQFVRRTRDVGGMPRLVQTDGQLLPFGDATFDAVLMIQVFGAVRGWRRMVEEARRVLRPSGALILGRTVAPADGLDTRMKQRLASFLGEADTRRTSARDEVRRYLAARASSVGRVVAAAWDAERTRARIPVAASHRRALRAAAGGDPGGGAGQARRLGRRYVRLARRRPSRAARIRARVFPVPARRGSLTCRIRPTMRCSRSWAGALPAAR